MPVRAIGARLQQTVARKPPYYICNTIRQKRNAAATRRERNSLKRDVHLSMVCAHLTSNLEGAVMNRKISSRLHGAVVYDRSIDVQILRLRRKLEQDPTQPQYIKTERGAG